MRLQEVLRAIDGQRLMYATGDSGDDREDGNDYVCLHFGNGVTLRFRTPAEGFELLDVEDVEG